MYLLQFLGDSSYDYKDLIIDMDFIELGFDVLHSCQSDELDEFGDMD